MENKLYTKIITVKLTFIYFQRFIDSYRMSIDKRMTFEFVVLIFISNFVNTINSDSDGSSHQNYYEFPDTIPIFNVRKDRYTALEVSRGKLNELGIINLYG